MPPYLQARDFDVQLSIPPPQAYNIAFLLLHFLGAVTFVVILGLTELLHRYNIRHHAWRSFCASWIVFGLSYSVVTSVLLSHRGGNVFGKGEMVLCAIQAGLIYAAPVLVANTTLALIIQLWSIMLFGMDKAKGQLNSCARLLIAIVPWIIWIINFFGVLMSAFMSPSMVEMNSIGTYCHLKTPTVSKVMASWLAIASCFVVGIEVFLVVLMYKRGFRLAGRCDASKTAMRLGVFMLQAIASVGIALVFIITGSSTIALDLIIAIQSPCAALIFGMRTSILCCSARRSESRLAKSIEASSSPSIGPHEDRVDLGNRRRISLDSLPSVTSSILVIGYGEGGGRCSTNSEE